MFENNQAPYGSDFASYPLSIDLNGGEVSEINFISGQYFTLNMTILDQEGRIYSDENDAIARIFFLPD